MCGVSHQILMQWEVNVGEGSSGKWRWIAGIEQDDEGPFTLISLDLLLFKHLTELLCSQGVFDLLKSCKMTTQDSPPYTPWCPFIGGAPSAFSKPHSGWWTACACGGLSLPGTSPSQPRTFYGGILATGLKSLDLISKYSSWHTFGSLYLFIPPKEIVSVWGCPAEPVSRGAGKYGSGVWGSEEQGQ